MKDRFLNQFWSLPILQRRIAEVIVSEVAAPQQLRGIQNFPRLQQRLANFGGEILDELELIDNEPSTPRLLSAHDSDVFPYVESNERSTAAAQAHCRFDDSSVDEFYSCEDDT